jgi:hypothetical protein
MVLHVKMGTAELPDVWAFASPTQTLVEIASNAIVTRNLRISPSLNETQSHNLEK